jgi:hypothetical protein
MRTTRDMGLIYAFAPRRRQIRSTPVGSAPIILPENTELAFRGEPAWAAATLTDRQAQQLLASANACGRPNSDVLRRRIAVVDGAPAESWQIDFPAHFTLQEAALYEGPFDHLQRHAPDWQNPHLNPALRRALARMSRYLAMPADADTPDWIWIEDEPIPDHSLVVVARDDDFTHGILASDAFAAWFQAHHATLPADQLVGSFPFPWPPATGLGSLSAAQEESRHAVARAIRGNHHAALHEAVCRAYGWAIDLSESELLGKITARQHARAK